MKKRTRSILDELNNVHGAYDFVGCHTVGAENPKNGETAWAIWPGNKLKEGQKLYFKKVNPETLEIGKVQTATPCK